jgi:hypothetical protein
MEYQAGQPQDTQRILETHALTLSVSTKVAVDPLTFTLQMLTTLPLPTSGSGRRTAH